MASIQRFRRWNTYNAAQYQDPENDDLVDAEYIVYGDVSKVFTHI